MEFLLNVCVGGWAHYSGEFGVLEHPPYCKCLAGIALPTGGPAIRLKNKNKKTDEAHETSLILFGLKASICWIVVRNVSIALSCPFNMSQLFPKSILLHFRPRYIYNAAWENCSPR